MPSRIIDKYLIDSILFELLSKMLSESNITPEAAYDPTELSIMEIKRSIYETGKIILGPDYVNDWLIFDMLKGAQLNAKTFGGIARAADETLNFKAWRTARTNIAAAIAEYKDWHDYREVFIRELLPFRTKTEIKYLVMIIVDHLTVLLPGVEDEKKEIISVINNLLAIIKDKNYINGEDVCESFIVLLIITFIKEKNKHILDS